MHHVKVTSNDIRGWIEEKSKGIATEYNAALADTEVAIEIFYSLSVEKIDDVVEFADYLIRGLELYCNTPFTRGYEGNSFYRAFLSLQNDSIVNFRLSRHDATEPATDRAWMRDGQPDIQYHLTIERIESTSPNPKITDSRLFNSHWIEVCNISLSDFNGNDKKRWDFLRKIINYLKYGEPSITESKQYKYMKRKQLKEAYDMNRVSRWGKRNGYELNGNVLSNGDEDITFNNDGEYDSSSQGFPSSDFEKYMNGTPMSSDELRQYVGSKIGSDYHFTQAIAEYDEEAMGNIANDMSQEMDCTPEEALDAIHKVANEYAYYNPSEGDLQESAKKGKKKITESQLRNVIAESIKSILKERDIRYDFKKSEQQYREEEFEKDWHKLTPMQMQKKYGLTPKEVRIIQIPYTWPGQNEIKQKAIAYRTNFLNNNVWGHSAAQKRINSGDFDNWLDDIVHTPEGSETISHATRGAKEYLKTHKISEPTDDELNEGHNTSSKITESKLRSIVAESVKKVLKEAYNPQDEDYLGYRNGDPKPKSKEEREKERKLRDKNWDNPSAWKNMMKEDAEYKNLFSFDNQFFDEKAAQMAEQLGNYLAQKYGVSDDIIATIGEVINDAINSNSLRA